MKPVLFNIGFILDVIAFVVIFLFPAPAKKVSTEIILEDGTPMGDGMTAGEHRARNERVKRRNTVISRIGFVGAIVGMALMWYSNTLGN